MNYPQDIKYTKDHEWIKLIDGNIAYVGITDYAQSELGEIVFVDINTIGEQIDAEEVFGTIEAVKTVSDLFMPVNCTVLEINPELDNNPELVNEDPYGSGWIVKIEVKDPADVNALMDSKSYTEWLGKD